MEIEKPEPDGYLFTCRKPGRTMQFVSIESAGTEGWPWSEDRWRTVERVPLVAVGEPTLIWSDQEAIAKDAAGIAEFVAELKKKGARDEP